MINLAQPPIKLRAFAKEQVATAFERLRGDWRPLVHYRDIEMQFIEPPTTERDFEHSRRAPMGVRPHDLSRADATTGARCDLLAVQHI
ncbi:MAG: hypothetical protein JWN03_3190 [Nocardia sp.]|nr:hypothetical protein [Nocardia sp.]